MIDEDELCEAADAVGAYMLEADGLLELHLGKAGLELTDPGKILGFTLRIAEMLQRERAR